MLDGRVLLRCRLIGCLKGISWHVAFLFRKDLLHRDAMPFEGLHEEVQKGSLLHEDPLLTRDDTLELEDKRMT